MLKKQGLSHISLPDWLFRHTHAVHLERGPSAHPITHAAKKRRAWNYKKGACNLFPMMLSSSFRFLFVDGNNCQSSIRTSKCTFSNASL